MPPASRPGSSPAIRGGEKNAIGDYWIVRQSDAHAWTEVWLANRGWVRIDPTAAVAPERVEQGIGSALAGAELPAFLNPALRNGFRFNLKARWDWVNARWNHWVLGYGPELQAEFLRRFGISDWSEMILALTVLLSVLLTVFGLLFAAAVGTAQSGRSRTRCLAAFAARTGRRRTGCPRRRRPARLRGAGGQPTTAACLAAWHRRSRNTWRCVTTPRLRAQRTAAANVRWIAQSAAPRLLSASIDAL